MCVCLSLTIFWRCFSFRTSTMTRPSFTRPRPTSSFESVNCSVACGQTAPLYSTFSRHCVFWMSLTTLSTASARASSCGWGHHKNMSHIHPSKTRFHFYKLPTTQTLTIPHTIDRHFKVLSVCSEPIRLHRSNSPAVELLIHHTYTHKHCDNDKCRFANKRQIKIPPHQHNVSQMFDARGERYRTDLSRSHTHTLLLWAKPVSMATSEHVPLGGELWWGYWYRGHPEREKETDRERTCAYLKRWARSQNNSNINRAGGMMPPYTHKHTPTHAQSAPHTDQVENLLSYAFPHTI